MRKKKSKSTANNLKSVSCRFNEWRKNRSNRKERIPERLLKQAARLSGHYTCAQISRALGLNYSRLKEYVDARQAGNSDTRPAMEPAFTFIPLKAGSGSFSAATEIIVEKQNGIKVRIRLAGLPTEETIRSLRILF